MFVFHAPVQLVYLMYADVRMVGEVIIPQDPF
jgi:hypothetical protein